MAGVGLASWQEFLSRAVFIMIFVYAASVHSNRCLVEFCNCTVRVFSDATCPIWPVVRTDNGTGSSPTYGLFISRFDSMIEMEGQAFAKRPASSSANTAPVVDIIYVVNNLLLKRIKGGAFLGLDGATLLRIADNRRLDFVDRCALPGDRSNLSEVYLRNLPELKYFRFLTNVYLSNLERIVIIDSGVEHISEGTFHQKPKLREVILRGTRLRLVDGCIFRPFFDMAFENKLLFVTGRNFRCDCDMYQLRGILNDTSSNYSTSVQGTSEATCAEPSSQRGKSIYAYGIAANKRCPPDGPACRVTRTSPCVYAVGTPAYTSQNLCFGKKCGASEVCYHGRCLVACDDRNASCADDEASCVGSMCVCQTGKFLDGGGMSCSKSRGERVHIVHCSDDGDCSYPYTCLSERCVITCHQASDCSSNASACVANMCSCLKPTMVLLHPCSVAESPVVPTDSLTSGTGGSVWVYTAAALGCLLVISVAVAISCRRGNRRGAEVGDREVDDVPAESAERRSDKRTKAIESRATVTMAGRSSNRVAAEPVEARTLAAPPAVFRPKVSKTEEKSSSSNGSSWSACNIRQSVSSPRNAGWSMQPTRGAPARSARRIAIRAAR